jgi:hypothetical protein
VASLASPTQFNLDYYTSLATSEYFTAVNWRIWLSANLQLFQDAYNCIQSFPAAYDLQQAVGPQLDVLGSIIGQSRTVGFQPSNSVSPILDDTTYRLLLQARVYQNHWGGTTQELRPIWNALFPGGTMLITDTQNMEVSIVVSGAFTSIVQDLILNGEILPRPQGVLYNIAFGELPILGFDENTSLIAGVDLGHFAG